MIRVKLMWLCSGYAAVIRVRLTWLCRFWPVRSYPWGRCEALSSTNSDLAILKRLLFEEGFAQLKQGTEERYYRSAAHQAKPWLRMKTAATAAAAAGCLCFVQ